MKNDFADEEREANDPEDITQLIRAYGMTVKEMLELLKMDRQKYARWNRPGNSNRDLLTYAVKYVLRVLLESGKIKPNEKKRKMKRTPFLEYKMWLRKSNL